MNLNRHWPDLQLDLYRAWQEVKDEGASDYLLVQSPHALRKILVTLERSMPKYVTRRDFEYTPYLQADYAIHETNKTCATGFYHMTLGCASHFCAVSESSWIQISVERQFQERAVYTSQV